MSGYAPEPVLVDLETPAGTRVSYQAPRELNYRGNWKRREAARYGKVLGNRSPDPGLPIWVQMEDGPREVIRFRPRDPWLTVVQE